MIKLTTAQIKVSKQFKDEYCNVTVETSKHTGSKSEIRWRIYVHKVGSTGEHTKFSDAFKNIIAMSKPKKHIRGEDAMIEERSKNE